MQNGNIFDYMIDVGEAGDKTYSNGVQEKVLTNDDAKRLNELAEQIARKKMLELERGNVEHIKKVLQTNTPDAAIYRATLLQQLENKKRQNQYLMEQRMLNKKSGVAQSQQSQNQSQQGWLGWIGSKAWNTAKYMGLAALQYLALKALFNYKDIYKNGVKQTWKNWITQAGVAMTPELAKQRGADTAAVGADILKTGVDFSKLSPEDQVQVTKILQGDTYNVGDINSDKAKFFLQTLYKDKEGNYLDTLKTDAKLSDYTKETAMMFNSGADKAPNIPISRTDFGANDYDKLFKVGSVRTVISPDENWLLGNQHVRAVDNMVYHIGDLSSYNYKKRTGNKDIMGFAPAAKGVKIQSPYTPEELAQQKLDEENAKKAEEEKQAKILQIKLEQHKKHKTKIMKKLEMFTRILDKGGRYKTTYADISSSDVDGIINFIEKMDPKNYDDQAKLLKKLNINQGKGIDTNLLVNFFHDAMDMKFQNKSENEFKAFFKKNLTGAWFNLPFVGEEPQIRPNVNMDDIWQLSEDYIDDYNNSGLDKYSDFMYQQMAI